MSDRLVIDAHMHIYRSEADTHASIGEYEVWEYGAYPVEFAFASGTAQDADRALRAAGAAMAIVPNLLEPPRAGRAPADDLADFNRWLCNLAAADDRIVPFISVDPRWQTVEEQVATIQTLTTERGARGIKIHPPIQSLDVGDEHVRPIFETCRALGIGVLSHSGPSRDGGTRGEPDRFRPLLAAVPGLRISIAHLGGAKWRQTAALARDYPSVYFDCCEIIGWLGAPNAPSRDEFVQLVRDIGIERVMIGSDYPWYEPADSVAQVEALPFSEQEKSRILGENAAAFIGL
jgi:uncharacterized protein